LSPESFHGRKYPNSFSSHWISDLLFRLKFSSPGQYGRNALNLPPKAQVGLLAFPKFDKEHARQAVDNSIDDRKVTQQEPAAETKDGREDKKDKVRLQEGEIEANLLPESIADLVEITGGKERFLTPILDQIFVRGFVVQRED
jgi:hypothetical protein